MSQDAVRESAHAQAAGEDLDTATNGHGPTPEPSLTDTGMYAQIVTRLRDHAFSNDELAGVVGVNARQVSNWASGHNVPRGARRDRLLEVDYIVAQLREIYTNEGVEIWLHGRKKSLGHQRPIDLLREGRFQTVLAAIERLNAGAM